MSGFHAGADFDWAGLWQVVRDWEMLHHVGAGLNPMGANLRFLLKVVWQRGCVSGHFPYQLQENKALK